MVLLFFRKCYSKRMQQDNIIFYDPMISYAQNAEDVILRRAFHGIKNGFYVDVGAADPLIDSVTKHFYDLGWRGINIEPQPLFYNRIKRDRKRDINLNIAVGEVPGDGQMTTFPFNEGLATLNMQISDHHRAKGLITKAIDVKVQTLENILLKYAKKRIDFIKVDVEGSEQTVLNSFDIKKWKPKVLIIESTFPDTQIQTHSNWEPRLLDADYQFCLFDGLNRFYAHRDEHMIIKNLTVPTNSFDRYIPYRFYVHLQLQRQLDIGLLFDGRYTLWHSKSYEIARSITRAAIDKKLETL